MALYGTFKYGAKKYGKNIELTEAVILVDVRSFLTMPAAKTETIMLTDLFSSSTVFVEYLYETIAIVGSLGNFVISKVIVNTIAVVDDLLVAIGRLFTETIAIADTEANQAEKTLNEAVTINDGITKSTATTFLEAVVLVDDMATVLGITLAEVISVVDSLSRGYFRTFTETINIRQFFRAVLNGVIVGLWRKVARNILDWTKRDRNL